MWRHPLVYFVYLAKSTRSESDLNDIVADKGAGVVKIKVTKACRVRAESAGGPGLLKVFNAYRLKLVRLHDQAKCQRSLRAQVLRPLRRYDH